MVQVREGLYVGARFKSWAVVCWIIIIMTSFDLKTFIDDPTVELFDKCRKDDLLAIASHFQIPVAKQSLKKEIKNVVWDRLLELKVLVVPDSYSVSVGAEGVSGPDVTDRENKRSELLSETGAEEVVRSVLPPFDPFSPVSSGSKGDARLKVCIARLQMEAQEKADKRQAELDLRLKICTLEIEAEKQVKMRQLELDAMKIVGGVAAVQSVTPSQVMPAPSQVPSIPSRVATVSPPADSNSVAGTFDVGKYITLVPHFRETEVDSYFNAFERIATSLCWPKEAWTILLQCKLIGKAQEVFSTLPLEESLNYDAVKLAILRAYELVPEAYRQRFRNHKKKF